jgi:hypothetical protein
MSAHSPWANPDIISPFREAAGKNLVSPKGARLADPDVPP